MHSDRLKRAPVPVRQEIVVLRTGEVVPHVDKGNRGVRAKETLELRLELRAPGGLPGFLRRESAPRERQIDNGGVGQVPKQVRQCVKGERAVAHELPEKGEVISPVVPQTHVLQISFVNAFHTGPHQQLLIEGLLYVFPQCLSALFRLVSKVVHLDPKGPLSPFHSHDCVCSRFQASQGKHVLPGFQKGADDLPFFLVYEKDGMVHVRPPGLMKRLLDRRRLGKHLKRLARLLGLGGGGATCKSGSPAKLEFQYTEGNRVGQDVANEFGEGRELLDVLEFKDPGLHFLHIKEQFLLVLPVHRKGEGLSSEPSFTKERLRIHSR
mmetsp:Transcript_13193/g.34550  ORF Transcript_13193/g.34550 Transcript_13193/m.34550 type:complete len:323 (-) Transcript_13193:910-1878(-)